MRYAEKRRRGLAVTGALCSLAATLGVACSAVAGPVNYQLLTTIPVTGNPLNSFDISFFDPGTNAVYLADRSNAAVDIFSAASLSQIGSASDPLNPFTGAQSHSYQSGPDGVLVTGPGGTPFLFAGNGNSTLQSFDVSNPASPTVLFPPINTGGVFRVDEMAYSPTTHLLLAANNAEENAPGSPPSFGTLFDAQTGAIVHGGITIPGAVGLEQPVWDPNTNSFFISVPSFGGGEPGGVAEIKTDGTIGQIYNFADFGITSCSPTGLALGDSGNLMVGCGDQGTQTVLLNPTGNGGAGSVVKIPQISKSDEIWYNPGTHDFYVTGIDATNGRAFDVISDTSIPTILDSVALPDVNAHSITVDLFNGDVFVPLENKTIAGATDLLCPLGCIAVFAAVPEPPSLLLIVTALLGLAGFGWLRQTVR